MCLTWKVSLLYNKGLTMKIKSFLWIRTGMHFPSIVECWLCIQCTNFSNSLKLMLHRMIFNDNSHRNGMPSQSDFIQLHLHCESSFKIGQRNIRLNAWTWCYAIFCVVKLYSFYQYVHNGNDYKWLQTFKLMKITIYYFFKYIKMNASLRKLIWRWMICTYPFF